MSRHKHYTFGGVMAKMAEWKFSQPMAYRAGWSGRRSIYWGADGKLIEQGVVDVTAPYCPSYEDVTAKDWLFEA